MLSFVITICFFGIVVGVILAFLWDVFNHWRSS